MTEPTERLPASDNASDHEKQQERSTKPEQKTVDPMDLVYSGGYNGDPREIVENPAVTPEMLNEPGDLRADELEED
jgi:hypothetical protein